MKVVSWMLLLGLSTPLQALPRNPFLMPSSPCEARLKYLDGWQLRGVLYRPEGSVALMTDSRPRWHRVKAGQFLAPDVQVTALLARQIRVTLKGICEGRYYHWEIQGGANEKTYHSQRVIADTAGGVGH